MKFFLKNFSVVILLILTMSLTSCDRNKYHLGDIVMSNGNILSSKEYKSYKGTAEPMAVIFSLEGGYSENSNRVLGLGIKSSSEKLSFAKKNDTSDYRFNASDVLNQKYDENFKYYINNGFSGTLDGRNIWYNISNVDEDTRETLAPFFPAYKFSTTYGKQNNYSKFSKYWYLPSAAELYILFRNKKIVNDTLRILGVEEFHNKQFWSSSENYNKPNNQYYIDAATGEIGSDLKTATKDVWSVYCFSDKKKSTNRFKRDYKIGDIVMSNGKTLSPGEYLSYQGTEKPIAIVFSLRGGHFEESSRVLCVGIHESQNPLAIASENSAEEKINFRENSLGAISQTYNYDTGIFKNDGFSGITNGMICLKNISKRDKNAKKEKYKNYPALEFAANYGRGWYLPTAAELYEMFEEKDTVNKSMALVEGDLLKNHSLWSSSQSYYNMNGEYLLDMGSGEVIISYKSSEIYVRSVYCLENSNQKTTERKQGSSK